METLKYDTTLDLKTGKKQLPAGGKIELKKVCFTYPKEKNPVLDGLSVKINQGERVAIIGNSGMGKSTLINVMQHAYEIQSGSVMINGHDVHKISLKSLKDNITYINQHPIFWTEKNIRAKARRCFCPADKEVTFESIPFSLRVISSNKLAAFKA